MSSDKTIGVGVGVAVMQDGKVLLGKRHENPKKASTKLPGAGRWTMPRGKMEFGESFEEAAAREVMEETGIAIKNPGVVCLNNDQAGDIQFITVGLMVKEFDGEPTVKEPDVITEWRWFSLDDLPSPLYFPSEKIIKNLKQKKFYIGK